MSGANTFKFVMLPPQSEVTRGWGRRLAEAMPEVRVVIAEDQATAEREIVDAEAAFGWLPREVLAKARAAALAAGAADRAGRGILLSRADRRIR